MQASLHSQGFTLIEMLVAVSMFVVVVMTTGASVIATLEANRKAQSTQIVMNNLNFALENITRSLRVGDTYHCDVTAGVIDAPRNCPAGASSVAFEAPGGDRDSASDQVAYQLVGTHIERSEDGGTTFVPITAPEVMIQSLQFFVVGADNSDTSQPKVVVTLRGVAGKNVRTETTFDLQTTFSQRALDL